MHQLFYNLLNNAIKFSKAEEPPAVQITSRLVASSEIEVHPELDKTKRYCELIFRDNGIGFNAKYAEKIFGIFQRLHNKADYSGTGIGLALCKKVVMNHCGKIWAESEEGAGASFIMLLPLDLALVDLHG